MRNHSVWRNGVFVMAVALVALLAQPALAQNFTLNAGYVDLQADGTVVYANCMGEWSASDWEDLWGFCNVYVVAGLKVDGGDVMSPYGELWSDWVENISTDPRYPTVAPISWQYDVSVHGSGWHTVTFYAFASGSNGFDYPYGADGFQVSIQVYVP